MKTKTIYKLIVVVFLLVATLLVAQVSEEEKDFIYGKRLYKEGFFDLAAIQFENFVEDYPASPKSPEALFLAAECAFSSGQFQKAQKMYMKLILKYPASSFVDKAQFRIAECFEKSGKIKDAIASYSRIYTFTSGSPWIAKSLYRSSKLSFEIGNLIGAESLLKELLGSKTTEEYRSKASFLLSQVYVKEEKYEKAIQLLKSLASHPFIMSDQKEAIFRLGKIYETLGYWDESEGYYRKVIASSVNDNLKQRAYFSLGLLLKMEGKNREAIDFLQKASLSGEDKNLKARALFFIGEIKKREGHFKSALEAFEKALQNSGSSYQQRINILLEKAQSLEALNRIPQAIDIYESILQDSSAVGSVEKQSLLLEADLFVKIKDFEHALDCYNRYLRLFKNDPLTSGILLKEGEITVEKLNLIDEGFQMLSRVWNDFPKSSFVPEARFVYAKGLENAGRTKEASRVYQMIFRYYPGTIWAEKAKRELNKLETFCIYDSKKGFLKLAELVQENISSQTESDILFQLGTISFNELKQYKPAIRYFSSFISFSSDSGKKAIALFNIGRSYEALYLKTNASTFLDSAKKAYESILSKFPHSSLADNANLKLLQLKPKEAPNILYQKYAALLKRYPDSDKRDEILFRMGIEAVKEDSLDRGMQIFSRLIKTYSDTLLTENALYQLGMIHFNKGNFTAADSLFGIYSEKFPQGRFLPEIYFYRSRIALLQKDYDREFSFLTKLEHRFYFSPWADSARVYLGEFYLRKKAYSKALQFYRAALVEDSLNVWAASLGIGQKKNSYRKIFLAGLAKAYESLKQYKKAKFYYYKYGREYRDVKDRVFVFSALARIAEKEKRPSRAVEYLSQLVKTLPSDSTAEKLGCLYFRLGKYSDAIEAFKQALILSRSEAKKISLNARIIVSLLRQGKIPQADVRIQIFSRSFKKSPQFKEAMAEFALEKGLAYQKDKDFEKALKFFRMVVDKYKKTNYAPQAELEVGRTYLITNKVDKALDILTGMVSKYKNDSVLAKVYLNLGDHYFRSHQYDNAVRAFKLAMKDTSASDVVSLAMRYLIRVYDSIRMWDAALALTREYIRRFPHADDLLQKKVQIGTFYMDLKEYSRAVEYFREIKKEADPETEAEIQYWIGKCYYNMGQFDQAIFEFLKVNYISKPTKLPWATTAMYEAGQAYLKLKKPQKARKLFRKIVIREGANSDLGRIARKRIEEIDANVH